MQNNRFDSRKYNREYQRNRYQNDPEYRERRKQDAREYQRNRYQNDPEYREKRKQDARQRHHRKKADSEANTAPEADMPCELAEYD